jgi:hypothetical protein
VTVPFGREGVEGLLVSVLRGSPLPPCWFPESERRPCSQAVKKAGRQSAQGPRPGLLIRFAQDLPVSRCECRRQEDPEATTREFFNTLAHYRPHHVALFLFYDVARCQGNVRALSVCMMARIP